MPEKIVTKLSVLVLASVNTGVPVLLVIEPAPAIVPIVSANEFKSKVAPEAIFTLELFCMLVTEPNFIVPALM